MVNRDVGREFRGVDVSVSCKSVDVKDLMSTVAEPSR